MDVSVFELGSQGSGKSHREVYEAAFNRAEIADKGGLDAYYVTEHHFDPDFQIVPSPHLLIPSLSERTTTIKLGVMCTILPQHHPVRVAEEIRMMDLLSGGRLVMGFGRGAQAAEQVGYGIDRAKSETLFDQSLGLVKQFLSEDVVESYDAGPWQGDRVHIVPEATQKPHPPMWMTAVSDKSLVKAGRLGLSVATSFMAADEVERTMAVYREAWRDHQPAGTNGTYATMHHVYVAASEEEANEVARPHIEGWLGDWLKIVGDKPKDGVVDKGYEQHAEYFSTIASQTFDDAVAKDMIIFGTPDRCAAQLARHAKRGVDEFMGWFQFGNLDVEAGYRSLQLFCDEVVPRLRRMADAAE